MMCKIQAKEFKAAVLKKRGLFKDYPVLVPYAAKQFLSIIGSMSCSTGIEVSIYEIQKHPDQAEGIFFAGVLVNEKPDFLPEGVEYLHLQQQYAMTKGLVTEISSLYGELDLWIESQGYQHDIPDHYMVEVYYPLDDDVEEVEIYIPVRPK
jgi:predicted transcriptional regulator YdeE